MSLPAPENYFYQDRIFTDDEVGTGNQRPGIRASENNASWWWRSIKYTDSNGHVAYLNRNSAVKYLERYNDNSISFWTSDFVIIKKIIKVHQSIAKTVTTPQAIQKPPAMNPLHPISDLAINHSNAITKTKVVIPQTVVPLLKPPVEQRIISKPLSNNLGAPPAPPITIDPKIESLTTEKIVAQTEQFSFEELLTFKAVLETYCKETELPKSLLDAHSKYTVKGLQEKLRYKVTVEVEGKWYVVWKANKAINIQNLTNYLESKRDNELGITIDSKGKVASIGLNGQDSKQTKVPEIFLSVVKASIIKSLEISSSHYLYTTTDTKVHINVVKWGLIKNPAFHLIEFVRAIEKATAMTADPKILITFLKSDLTRTVGVDTGGLSRDYLDDLFKGLTESKKLRFQKINDSSLKLPSAQTTISNNGIHKLNTHEQEVYEHVGKLLMYCYNSKPTNSGYTNAYTTGRYFDDALFQAALCLRADEINAPFENLTIDTYIRMCKALINERKDLAMYKKFIFWFERFEQLSEIEVGQVIENLEAIDYLPDELKTGLKSRSNRLLKSSLIEALFSINSADHGQFGAQLAPIHAIAKGMKSFSKSSHAYTSAEIDNHWNSVFTCLNGTAFSAKVQGSGNVNDIANNIILEGYPTEELNKKMGWLKNWIRNKETLPQDVRAFLKYATGGTCLPSGQQIKVKPSYANIPIMKAHTCFFTIEMSNKPCGTDEYNDFTEEGFIKCLKFAMYDSGYSEG